MSKTDSQSRRSFLAAGAGVAASMLARPAAAGGNPANQPPNVPEWTRSLGEGVAVRPYGKPSKFEKDVVRRDVEWLTASRESSVSFTPLHELEGIITPNGLCFERHHGGIAEVRKPFASDLAKVLGRTDSLLYRRGNFNGTFDDLICQALLQERDAEIALSPGFRWGTSVLPGQDITFEDVTNATAITYPAVYRMGMTGARLKEIIEDVADNLFNVDPYYQQGGDMVRIGGLSYAIDVAKPQGSRISDMQMAKTGAPIDPGREYQVAGWASVNEGTEGPPIWDVVANYLTRQKTVRLEPNRAVKVTGA